MGHLLGVDEIRADRLPEDKLAAVRELRERHGAVAMIGDGVNDAPALAEATVGIAMGAIGSPATIETADVALMTDDLRRGPPSRRCRHRRRHGRLAPGEGERDAAGGLPPVGRGRRTSRGRGPPGLGRQRSRSPPDQNRPFNHRRSNRTFAQCHQRPGPRSFTCGVGSA
ncbi:MAG: HAD family hydrolase [Gemmatimonadales bacterium]